MTWRTIFYNNRQMRCRIEAQYVTGCGDQISPAIESNVFKAKARVGISQSYTLYEQQNFGVSFQEAD